MSCAAIMTTNPLTVRDDETVGAATQKLIAHGHADLPVVDASGRYVGMFGVCDVLGLLVPRVALAGDTASNLRFLDDDTEALKRRFAEVKGRRLGEALNRHAPALAQETPQGEAIRHFCRNHMTLAVTERETAKVVGVVSPWDAIRTIAALA